MSIPIDAPELEYSQIQRNHGSYSLYKITPVSGVNTVTLTTSGGNETLFEIPAQTYNHSRNILAFDLTPTASGNGKYNWIYSDCWPMIRTIEFYSRSQVYPIRVNDVNKYTHMLFRHELKLSDVANFDSFGPNDGGICEGIRLNNCLTTEISAMRPNFENSKTSYTEPKYITVGADNTANPVIKYRLKLGLLLHTFFALDKDTYFNEIMTLRIVWAPTTQIGFSSTSATNPSTNAAAFAGTMAVSNLYLYCAKENNQLIDAATKAKVLGESFKMMIPFVWSDKQLLSTASQNISLKYDPHNGRRLMKIYHAAYHDTESSNTCYNRSGSADAKIIEFYTLVEGERRTQYNLDTSAYDDFVIMRETLNGSCIQSSDEFYYNHLQIENFCAEEDVSERKRISDNYIDGKPLDKEVKWEMLMTTAGNSLNHYTYAICLRELVISATGVLVY